MELFLVAFPGRGKSLLQVEERYMIILDKSLFDAVPVFVDSFGNFVLLDWKYIYKGSIRDFYPPVEYLPNSPNNFQVYAESVASSKASVGSGERDMAVEMLEKDRKAIVAGRIERAY